MKISEAAERAAKCIDAFSFEAEIACVTECCERRQDCTVGYCILGAERIQQAIDEVTAELKSENERLRKENALLAADFERARQMIERDMNAQAEKTNS